MHPQLLSILLGLNPGIATVDYIVPLHKAPVHLSARPMNIGTRLDMRLAAQKATKMGTFVFAVKPLLSE
jgi:hypothetical protein